MEKRQGELAALAIPAAMVTVAVLAASLRSGTGPAGPLALLGGLEAAGLALVWFSGERSPLRPGPLGRARHARWWDLRALHRHRGDGARVRLGTARSSPLFLPEDEHLLVLGPTGSGKSSSIAIPAILEWPGAVIVTDPKGELLERTIGARRERGAAAVFAPLMAPGDRWNPVAAISSSEDALRTAGFLMGKPPEREPFWHELALQLLHGLLVEAAFAGLTLPQLLALLQQVPAEEVAGEVLHPTARSLVQGALSGGDRTAMGVVATLVARLGVFGTGQVASCTSTSTFDPTAVANGGLATLYCVVSPPDAPLLRGLLSALLAACWRAVFADPPKVPVLFVLDEFAQLTALPELPSLVQLGRTQGVRMILLAQDLASIGSLYGSDTVTALWANCRTKMLLPGISEVDLLERASRLAGAATLHGGAGRRGDPLGPHSLIPPDEIRRLRAGRALVLRGSDHPAVIRQRPWFQDGRLRWQATRPGGEWEPPRPAPGQPIASQRLPSPRGPLVWSRSPVAALPEKPG